MSDTTGSEDVDEFILSLCWDKERLSAVFFNTESLELHVRAGFFKNSILIHELQIMSEILDLSPDYINMRHIFRQIKPSFLVAGGSNQFFEDLGRSLLQVPDDTDIAKFKVGRGQSSNAFAFNLCFYPLNRQVELRETIYQLDLPGLPADCSEKERKIFIDSVFPMGQDQFAIALSNLLRYLRENHLKWRQCFLNLDKNLIISNVVVFHPETQVIVDEMTFQALSIFSNVYHPSSFKVQVRHDGLSLFNFLNECQSSVGVKELKAMLRQPTRDMDELNLRFATIHWCLTPANYEHVKTLIGHLKNVLGVGSIVSRINLTLGRSTDWKSLKKTVMHIYQISEMCAAFSEDSTRSTLVGEIADFAKDNFSIKGVLYAIDKIVDLEGMEEKQRFTVKPGQNTSIDGKKEMIEELTINFMNMELDASLAHLRADSNAFQYVHYPEVGFVIATELKVDDLNAQFMQENDIELVLTTTEASYLRTPNCETLNKQYELLLTELIEVEMGVFKHLMTYIRENLADLTALIKLCAKLDVLISFASISALRKFVKPTITMDKKMEIVNGVHPLVNLIREYVPSTTIVDNQSLINIITAPNASGKSVYLKQVALIAFMAHIGMFVPAESCTVPLLHSIYTRMYTPESIYQCESAFLADLQQMSKMITNSTSRSLVIIDEFGKGTHFKDGLALLAASIEHFVQRGTDSPIVFVTTHFNQIHSMGTLQGNVKCRTITTKRNASGVFESIFEVTDGVNEQDYATENPESNRILKNIYEDNEM